MWFSSCSCACFHKNRLEFDVFGHILGGQAGIILEMGFISTICLKKIEFLCNCIGSVETVIFLEGI